jgi:two-component system sensor histidine kinase/response regulator
VLLVEDNELNQEVAIELLREVGFRVTVAANGLEAIDLTRTTRFDLVLMDMQMPVMDGVTATQELRRRGFSVPIVAMTANAMEGDRERCLAAGMNDHVAKPIDPEELWRAMARWIDPGAVRRDPAAAAPAEAPGTSFEGIAGLDTRAALRRLLGKQNLYIGLLGKFVAGQADAEGRIRQAVEAGDWATAERMAHTLKGVAGNIGATLLQEQADRLELGLRARKLDAALGGLIAELGRILATLVTSLRTHLPEDAGATQAPVSLDELRPVAEKLAALLASYDSDALELLEAQAGLLSAALPGRFRAIEDAVRPVDFEGALTPHREAVHEQGLAV